MLQERVSANSWFTNTVQSLFNETCDKRQEKIAIFYKDEKITFGQLQKNVNNVSSFLINLGIQPGDRVTAIPTTSPEFVYLYFATLQIGAIINPLNLLWGSHELKSVLERNDPKVIVIVDEHKGKNCIEMIRNAIPDMIYKNGAVSSEQVQSLTHVISVSNRNEKHHGFNDFQELFNQRHDRKEEIERRMEQQKSTDIQFICQTSGTTSLSKSALWDHRTALANANFCIKNLTFTEVDSYLNLSPFFHNGGILALNINLAFAGTTLYLLEYFDPEQALKAIDENKITTMFGFTAHWQGMRGVPNFSEYDFWIRKAMVAGDPKTYDLVCEMCHESEKVLSLYAQTEHGPVVSLGESDCMVSDIKKYMNGRPLPGVEIVIKDIHTGEMMTGNKGGEICYKSPYLFRGYYKQPEETTKSFDEDGFFHSGDFGTFENGYVHFLGRLGGVIKSGGENVSTLRVSLQLVDLFPNEVEDAQTIGINDKYWGTKAVSWIRWKFGSREISANELREKCKGKMADYEIPKEILIWEGEWPMTAEGKIDFKRLTLEAENSLSVK